MFHCLWINGRTLWLSSNFFMSFVVENRFVVNFFTIQKLNAKMLLYQKRNNQRRISPCFKINLYQQFFCKRKIKKIDIFFYGINRFAYSWLKYRKPFVKIKTARLWSYVFTWGCSVAKEQCCFWNQISGLPNQINCW